METQNNYLPEEKKYEISQLAQVLETESLKVQEARWIEEEIMRERAIEDEIREKLSEERRILDEKKRSIEENITRTEELRRYNDDHKREIFDQVYGLYGISRDRLEGIKTYRRALYKGCAGILFVLALALTVFCGINHGFSHELTVFLMGYTAVSAALLPRKDNTSLFGYICNILYFTAFPIMAVLFVCYELNFPEYKFLMPIFIIAGVILASMGTLSYFFYNPYSCYKSNIRSAGRDLKKIHNSAEKNVKKNMKSRKKAEAKEEAERIRIEKKEARLAAKEEAKQQKLAAKEEAKMQKLAAKEQAKQQKLAIKENASKAESTPLAITAGEDTESVTSADTKTSSEAISTTDTDSDIQAKSEETASADNDSNSEADTKEVDEVKADDNSEESENNKGSENNKNVETIVKPKKTRTPRKSSKKKIETSEDEDIVKPHVI